MSAHPYVNRYQDLEVYRKARTLASDVFVQTKNFPKEEQYSLTAQIRRSSGSIGAQIAEAWGKRRYMKHFVSKLTDADAEQLETQHWILVSRDRGYLTEQSSEALNGACQEIGKMLGHMMQRAASFCRADTEVRGNPSRSPRSKTS